MKSQTRILLGVGAFLFLLGSTRINTAAEPAAESKTKINFETDVAPILRQQCIDCHGPALQLADLRLDQRKYVIDEGQRRDLVQPGHSADSLLIQRLVDKKLGLIMPPTFPFFPGEKTGLPERQIQILTQWIDQGAVWPDGVSLISEAASSPESASVQKLMAAVRAADHRSVAQLLTDGSLVNIVDHHRATPLMYAALYADAAMVDQLIEQGANVNAADGSGATALMWAADDLEKVRVLLKHGAKVDAKTAMGRTPLLIAATYAGNSEVVRLLLEAGANVSARDSYGETVLTSASKRGDAELVELLIESGADVQSAGGFAGRTPLAWAAEEGNLATIACLLKHGAAKDAKSLNTALFNAAVRGPEAAVRLLLEHKADVSAAAGFAAYTPLMGAAYSETLDAKTVKLLLDRGADPAAKAATGETSLALAKKRGTTTIVELLANEPAAATESPIVPAKTATPEQVRSAAEKSLALLQKCGLEFFRKSGCVACHQQSVTSLALAEARLRGLKVDEAEARQQVQITVQTIKTYRDRFLQRVDHPANSAPAAGYLLLGLAAEGLPPNEYTDANVIEMAYRQRVDGSWTAFGHRPPMEYSPIAATALAVRAMQLYAPPGLKPAFEQRIARGREWLTAAPATTNNDMAFRLLGLAWTDAPADYIKAQRTALTSTQRADGGWSQLDHLSSDAYATGLTLYALHHGGGLAATDPAYQRGVNFLVQTQLADGSWHVKSRSFPFQTYFESGFPHGHDQWISAGATGFAAAALIDSLPLAASSGR